MLFEAVLAPYSSRMVHAMRYTVILEPVTDSPDHESGWFYAHIPAFDLTTEGEGVEGALAAARELLDGWIATLRKDGQPVPHESEMIVTQVEVRDDASQAA